MVILWRQGTYARTNIYHCTGFVLADTVGYVAPSAQQRVSITITSKKPGMALTSKKPGMALASKKPGITIEEGYC